jgi:hypothetical protein
MTWIVRAVVVVAAITSACSAQTISSTSSGKTVIWVPTKIDWPEQNFSPTVPREMIGALRVADFPVILEETELEGARKRFGGTIGSRGDGGESEAWLCLHGSDESGPWIFWLTSGELDGPAIMGFQWRRLSLNETPDRRCSVLPPDHGGIELPLTLHLGMTEADMRKIMGKPSFVSGKKFIYCHEHQEMIHNLPYTAENMIAIVLRGGTILAIEASKATTN